ncbi:odorant receptor 13a-like [Venturia canescens]|uniref:odorant receptor 13a-like n=1 Tax=Venturia canescens TaxID=32260 RepID=UPI001C9CFD58|nr:odorant receptor 13a-like [Venturia canescens]
MKLFDKSYYRMTKILLSFIGQWPLQTPWQKRIIRTSIVMFMLTIIIPEVIKFVDVVDRLDIVVECIGPLGLHVQNILKCSTVAYHGNKLVKFMTYMNRDWSSRKEKDGTKVLHRYAERSKALATGYTLYMIVGGSIYVCVPLMPVFLDVVKPLNETRPRETFFLTEYFIDQDKYYVPIFFHGFVTTNISMVIVAGCDTMYSAFVHYVCSIFVELGNELENPVTNKDDSFYVSKDDDYIFEHVRKCIKKHREVIELCDYLESTYTFYFFGTIGLNIFLISFVGVQTVTKKDDPSLFIRYNIYLMGQIMHAFFGCWHGQLLIDHSQEIITATYKAQWYCSSLRSRKLFTLMMMRSSKPCYLTAGKLFPVSLETFTTVMKTAMSYFTVLRSLQ